MKKTKNTKEKDIVVLEVTKAVDSLFLLLFLIMFWFPEVFNKISDVAANGDYLSKVWWCLIITLVISIYTGIVSFGFQKIKQNKKK